MSFKLIPTSRRRAKSDSRSVLPRAISLRLCRVSTNFFPPFYIDELIFRRNAQRRRRHFLPTGRDLQRSLANDTTLYKTFGSRVSVYDSRLDENIMSCEMNGFHKLTLKGY